MPPIPQTLLERSIAGVEHRLVLVAPAAATVSADFRNLTVDDRRHGEFVREMQRLRGGIYLQDGAVRPHELTPDGLHQTPEDERSWHLLMLSPDGRVNACAWYLEHANSSSMDSLRVRHCSLAANPASRETLRAAVESELGKARLEGLRYAEVGGWAVSRRCRCTSEGLVLALAAYSLGRHLGGALGLTTATVRHSSSTILKRLGGSHLEVGGVVVPPYFDPKYRCDMELLRFDSRTPSPKYAGLIERLCCRLSQVPVFACAQ